MFAVGQKVKFIDHPSDGYELLAGREGIIKSIFGDVALVEFSDGSGNAFTKFSNLVAISAVANFSWKWLLGLGAVLLLITLVSRSHKN